MFVKRGHGAHDFELNLTPIIDCFVTLICFLLLSATYVNLVGLDAKVPMAVLASSAAAQKDEPKFKLDLHVTSKGLELSASGAGALSGKKFIAGRTPDSLAQLHNELVKIKKARPKEFSINFNSSVDMPYEELVRLMDVTRNLDPAKDGELSITDERNGKPVKVDLLFPDFIIANLNARNINEQQPHKGGRK